MQEISTTRLLQRLGSIGLLAATAACGDADGRSEPSQETLTEPAFSEAALHAAKTPLSEHASYEVVIVDSVNLTHEPTAINNRGQIVGSARNNEDVRQPWFWDGERGRFLVGDSPSHGGNATDINRAGQVVGGTAFLRDYNEDPGNLQFRTRAFIYDGTSMSDFGTLSGNSQSRAEGVNQRGDVVGTTYGGPGEQHAVLYRDGQIIDLGQGRALAINKRGEVVGGTVVVDVTHAFLYSSGKLLDLGTMGGETSIAVDINDAGEIVGNSQTATGQSRAFLHSDGAMLELPIPGETSSAAAINRHGQVVGVTSSLAAPAQVDGYLYQDGHVALLKDLIADSHCWRSLEARDINDHADIVGVGVVNSDAGCPEPGRYLIVVTQRPNRYR
jgi:probable HAF family extracellular repeat protein